MSHVVYDQVRSAPSPSSVDRSRDRAVHVVDYAQKRSREPNALSVDSKRFSQFTTFTLLLVYQ